MTTTDIPADRPNSGKTLLSLDNLAIPNRNSSPSWLESEAAKRTKSVEVLAEVTKKWFGIPYLPDSFWSDFAEQAIAALDQRV